MLVSHNKLIDSRTGGIGGRRTAVGVSYSEFVRRLVSEESGLVDYVEIPFEQLMHTPSVMDVREMLPVVLHCASLSIAGNVPPDIALVDSLLGWVDATETPWLGEHLAYVRADGVWRDIAEHVALVGGWEGRRNCSPPFNIGYTVSPQLSAPVMDRVLDAVMYWPARLGVPMLLENGPIYFEMPGSTMSQFDFIRGLCARSEAVLLLLDLAHLAISCKNLGVDPVCALDTLPLERVVEVHISGISQQAGIVWDDHSEAAPPLVFDLLERLLQRVRPRAITLEYNWSDDFPRGVLRRDVERVRKMVDVLETETART